VSFGIISCARDATMPLINILIYISLTGKFLENFLQHSLQADIFFPPLFCKPPQPNTKFTLNSMNQAKFA